MLVGLRGLFEVSFTFGVLVGDPSFMFNSYGVGGGLQDFSVSPSPFSLSLFRVMFRFRG